jgi:hypothetical protein
MDALINKLRFSAGSKSQKKSSARTPRIDTSGRISDPLFLVFQNINKNFTHLKPPEILCPALSSRESAEAEIASLNQEIITLKTQVRDPQRAKNSEIYPIRAMLKLKLRQLGAAQWQLGALEYPRLMEKALFSLKHWPIDPYKRPKVLQNFKTDASAEVMAPLNHPNRWYQLSALAENYPHKEGFRMTVSLYPTDFAKSLVKLTRDMGDRIIARKPVDKHYHNWTLTTSAQGIDMVFTDPEGTEFTGVEYLRRNRSLARDHRGNHPEFDSHQNLILDDQAGQPLSFFVKGLPLNPEQTVKRTQLYTRHSTVLNDGVVATVTSPVFCKEFQGKTIYSQTVHSAKDAPGMLFQFLEDLKNIIYRNPQKLNASKLKPEFIIQAQDPSQGSHYVTFAKNPDGTLLNTPVVNILLHSLGG